MYQVTNLESQQVEQEKRTQQIQCYYHKYFSKFYDGKETENKQNQDNYKQIDKDNLQITSNAVHTTLNYYQFAQYINGKQIVVGFHYFILSVYCNRKKRMFPKLCQGIYILFQFRKKVLYVFMYAYAHTRIGITTF
ncbi:hypothetical protein ABPG72_020908 [Tetrahymena utriculariae]